MTRKAILGIVNRAYPDDCVAQEIRERGSAGDTLAQFIVVEITETYDKRAGTREQLREASRVMLAARDQLDAVVEALDRADAAL